MSVFTTTRMMATAIRIQKIRGIRDTTEAADDWFDAVRFADQLFTCPWRTGVNAVWRR